MNKHLHYDYTTVGHVTVDVMDGGSRRPGGTAFYSALQAARLGRRTLIVTQGVPQEIEALLEPYRGELELSISPAPRTTTLLTSGSGAERSQRLLAWAGPLAEELELDTAILHLAPIARELPQSWRGRAGFVGLTPQGLVRGWDSEGDEISLRAPASDLKQLAGSCQALVLSEQERASCTELILAATHAGGLVALTAGAAPTTILLAGGDVLELEVPELEEAHEDLGAGDVFAAAFFIALEEGGAPEHAAAFANAAAAVRMRGFGAGAIGARAEIEARLRGSADPLG